jgi:hypothetical protein
MIAHNRCKILRFGIETKMKSLQTGLSEIEQNFDTINKVKFNLIDVANEEGRKIKEMVDGHIRNVLLHVGTLRFGYFYTFYICLNLFQSFQQ